MRKIFTLVAALCCTMFSVMATAVKDNVKITIGATLIEQENMANVTDAAIGSGTVSYDDATHTLTFDAANIDDGQVVIDASALTTSNVILEIKGTCFLTAKSKDAIHFKAGKGLTITGAAGATLNASSENIGKSSALFLAKDHSTSDPNEFFPLSVTGGVKLLLNNYFADPGYPTMVCHHMDVDNSLVQLWGQDGEDNIQVFKGGKGLNNLHNNVMEYGDYGYGYIYYLPYTKKFPVWVDGWQMTDGLMYNAEDGYYLLHSAIFSNVSGGVFYYPATRTVEFGSFATITGVNPAADAVIRIYDEDSTDPIDIKLTSTTKLLSKKAGVAGLRIETESTFDIYGNNIEINTDATADAPALIVTAPLTFKNTKKDFDTRSVKIYSESDDGIYGVGTMAKVTYDRCKGSIYGKLKVATGLEALTLNRAEYNDPNYKLYNNELCDGTTPLADKTVEIKINEWSLEVSASPAAGGTFTVKDESDHNLSNPYWYKETTKAVVDAKANTGYLFDSWRDIYDTELSKTTPYTIDLYKGSNATAVARFSRTVDTEADWYVMPEGSTTLYKFGAKFRGTLTSAPDVPLPSGNYMRRAVYVNGKIYYIAQNNSMDKTGMFSATFDGTTMGAQETVIDFQNDYFPIYAIAYNYTDECFYAVACKTADYTYPLLKIDPNATGDKITELGSLGSDGSNVKALTFTTAGEAYAILGSNELSTLDIASGIFTLVGELDGLYFSSAESVGFAADPTTNELFVVNSTTMGGNLYRIDPATANYEFVSSHTYFMNASALFTTADPVLGPMTEITVKVADGQTGWGTVSPSGVKKYAEGKKVTISATPAKGYLFKEWSDKGAQSHEITVGNEDATYTASFEKDPSVYPIYIAGEQLTASQPTLTTTDLPGVLTAGTISYDATAKELILDQVKLSYTGAWNILCGDAEAKNEGFTIVVKDKCEIIASAGAIAFFNLGAVKFVGDGTSPELIVKGTAGIYIEGTDLTIEGLKTTVTGTTSGISGKGNEVLTIKGAAVSVTGTGLGSITGIKNLKTEFCEIDAAHEFIAANKQVEKSGSVAKDEVKFEPYPMLEVTPVEKGSGHFTLKCGNVTFTDKGWFKNGDEVSITAVPEKGFEFGHWTDDSGWKTDAKVKPNGHDTHTMSGDKKYEGLAIFYYKSSSSSNWYGINDGNFVKFSLKDFGKKVDKSKTPDVTDVKAGDYVNGTWYYLDGADDKVKSLKISNLKDEQELDKNVKEEFDGVTEDVKDMAYDILGKKMYAVIDTKLYLVDTKNKKLEEVGEFEYESVAKKVVAIAIDAKKTPYLLSPDDGGVLYTGKVNTKDKKVVLSIVGDKANGGKVGVTVANKAQSMAFDHVKGEILWSDDKYLRIINPKTAKTYICGALGQEEETQGYVKSLHNMSKAVNVTVEVADGQDERGTVDGGGTIISGMSTTITATANTGWHFVYWLEEEDVNNPISEATYEVVATSSVTYTAYFEEGEGIESITIDPMLKVQKVLIDGVLYIFRDGRVYTVTGQLMQ